MSDLDLIRAAPIPRGPELTKKLVGRIEPLYGFAIYGVLWIFVAGIFATAGILAGIGVGLLAGFDEGSTGIQALSWVFMALGFALAWWPFVRWARRKRGRAREMVEHGELLEGEVSTTAVDSVTQAAVSAGMGALGGGLGGTRWFRVEFESDGMRRFLLCPLQARPTEGTRLTVLHHPGSVYALAFDPAGRACVGKVRG